MRPAARHEVTMGLGQVIHIHLLDVRVKVKMVAENIAGLTFYGANRRKLDIAPRLPTSPVDHVVLLVDAEPNVVATDTVSLAFPLAKKAKALTIDEVDLAVDRFRTHLGHLGNATDRLLGYELLKYRLVLVRFALTLKRRGAHVEGSSAGFTLHPYRRL